MGRSPPVCPTMSDRYFQGCLGGSLMPGVDRPRGRMETMDNGRTSTLSKVSVPSLLRPHPEPSFDAVVCCHWSAATATVAAAPAAAAVDCMPSAKFLLLFGERNSHCTSPRPMSKLPQPAHKQTRARRCSVPEPAGWLITVAPSPNLISSASVKRHVQASELLSTSQVVHAPPRSQHAPPQKKQEICCCT